MKKYINWLSYTLSLIAIVFLFLIRFTGLKMHILIGSLAVIMSILCAILGWKKWKNKTLEILMRVFLVIAFLSGAIL